jgi:hypothetical protein
MELGLRDKVVIVTGGGPELEGRFRRRSPTKEPFR